MTDFPHLNTSRDSLPADPDERREALIEVLGQHIIWSRNLVLARIQDCLQSSEVRKSLEPRQRRVYERISAAVGEEVAMDFAKETVDMCLRYVLGLVGNIGFDLRLGRQHAILYLLTLQLCDVEKEEVVEQVVLNRDQEEFFPDYLRIWLDRFSRS